MIAKIQKLIDFDDFCQSLSFEIVDFRGVAQIN